MIVNSMDKIIKVFIIVINLFVEPYGMNIKNFHLVLIEENIGKEVKNMKGNNIGF